MSIQRLQLLEQAARIVIKLGTAVLMGERGDIALSRFYSFVESISSLKRAGKEVLLVTSGAIGLGAKKIGLTTAPATLPQKQSCAAVGQGRLMSMYSDAFERFDILTAQVLVTEDDFSNRTRYLNLRNCVSELLQYGALPIFNENDTVSTAELESGSDWEVKVNFGDNDMLSALVASKMEADLLLILTDVDGLYTADPRFDATATLIPLVEANTPEIMGLESRSDDHAHGGLGRGGIKSKLAAARVATHSGCGVIIAGGKVPSVVDKIFAGDDEGTMFLPRLTLPGKRRWIAFATTVRASVAVDQGAREALVRRKSSLLPAGIVNVNGEFERGDVIGITDLAGKEFARGMVNYSSAETRKIIGLHSDLISDLIDNKNYDALITRDNIAFLEHGSMDPVKKHDKE